MRWRQKEKSEAFKLKKAKIDAPSRQCVRGVVDNFSH